MVLCITNTVAANFTANVLLSVGEMPAMVEDPDEAAELASAADAVLINIGTVTKDQAAVMRAAIKSCRAHNIPWVLDPVAAPFLSNRLALVQEFFAQKPSLIRANQAEFDYLDHKIQGFRGACPLLVTGPIDRVFDPDGTIEEVAGGVSMLQSVTATGCAQGAICAAFLGRGQAPKKACISASRLMKQAGERAFSRAKGPGSFQVALLDELYAISPIREQK